MLTIGEIQNRLEVTLFDEHLKDKLTLDCLEREKSIKSTINTVSRYIIENIERPGFSGKLTHWQEAKIERNIENLIKYIEKLFPLLEKENIIEYCRDRKKHLPVGHIPDMLIIPINSFYASAVLDIVWASDLSVGDLINISKGKINHKSLASKLPSKVRIIRNEIIPFLSKQPNYSDYIPYIRESVKSHKNKLFFGASLIILVVIEGLVRLLGRELISRQNLGAKYLNQKYYSLDSFLRKIPWEKDIKIEEDRLMFLSGDYKFAESRIETKYQHIDLKTRLDFLRRTYKKERDAILHGEMDGLGEAWDLYRNYSALYEVYLTIKSYKAKA